MSLIKIYYREKVFWANIGEGMNIADKDKLVKNEQFTCFTPLLTCLDDCFKHLRTDILISKWSSF
jgi:hypothetical protein